MVSYLWSFSAKSTKLPRTVKSVFQSYPGDREIEKNVVPAYSTMDFQYFSNTSQQNGTAGFAYNSVSSSTKISASATTSANSYFTAYYRIERCPWSWRTRCDIVSFSPMCNVLYKYAAYDTTYNVCFVDSAALPSALSVSAPSSSAANTSYPVVHWITPTTAQLGLPKASK